MIQGVPGMHSTEAILRSNCPFRHTFCVSFAIFCHFLFPDRPAPVEQVFYASGNDVDVGGFRWGLVVRGGCYRLAFRGCGCFPATVADGKIGKKIVQMADEFIRKAVSFIADMFLKFSCPGDPELLPLFPEKQGIGARTGVILEVL